MKQLKYILLFLLLPFTGQGQGIINSYAYVTAGGGGGGTCADADGAAYIADVESKGYTFTTQQKDSVCNFYVRAKALGVYTLIKAAWFVPYQNAGANGVNLITLTPYGTQTGSPINGSDGISTNGSTQFYNTNVSMSALTTSTSAGIGIYLQVNTNAGVGNRYFMANINAGGGSFIGKSVSGTIYQVNSNSPVTISSYTATENIHAIRTATGKIFYKNASSASTSGFSSASPSSVNVFIGARNSSGSGADFSTITWSWAMITTTVTPTEETYLNSLIENLHDGFGIGLQP